MQIHFTPLIHCIEGWGGHKIRFERHSEENRTRDAQPVS